MQFEQIYYPFNETTLNKEINNSIGNNTILYIGLFILLIGGGTYAYNKLTYKNQKNEFEI